MVIYSITEKLCLNSMKSYFIFSFFPLTDSTGGKPNDKRDIQYNKYAARDIK